MRKIDVLDKGYVELIDFMGSDLRILETARISTGSESDKGEARNRGLIRYLYTNKHSSPFEQAVFTFKVRCPIAIARQWMRHRTGSYNEYSLRYSEAITDYYIPDNFRQQGKVNHQGSGEEMNEVDGEIFKESYVEMFEDVNNLYKNLIDEGVAREQARMILPVGLYTEFYMTINLSNLFKFITLRRHEHAQQEIYVYADAILRILKDLDELKYSVEIFEDMNEIETEFASLLNKHRKNKNFDELKDELKLLNSK
jgi:thymidylate synthase (FAD)